MRKKLIALAFIFFISANAFAQTETTDRGSGESKGFRFGLQFSPHLDWTKAQDKHTTSSGVKVDFNYGLVADFSIALRYAVSTGINISQYSTIIRHEDTLTMFNSFPNDSFRLGTKASYKLQYIDIPLVLKLKTNEIGYVTYFGQFGFDLSVCTKSRGDISDNSGVRNKDDENLGPDISPFNLALNIGGGIEYSLSKSTAFITSLSFHNGFLDISDSPKDFKSKTILNAVELKVGILF